MIRGVATADLRICQQLLADGSRSFQAASWLLPRAIHEPATALYAFCRVADDAIDNGSDRDAELAQLRQRLSLAYAGTPSDHPADRAFAVVVAQHSIPRSIPEALLEGFEWDANGRRYHTLGELEAYAARVAGTVGVMMALLMGQRDRAVLSHACDLGVAMQLTNIARDVGEDARAGRLYLPEEWLHEAGIDPEAWLQQPVYTEAIGSVVQRLLHEADLLYARASAGIAWLPRLCRPGMHAARLLYAEIGNEVQRRGLDSVSGRARVSGARKLHLLGRASVSALAPRQPLDAQVLEEVRFLVEAVPANQTEALTGGSARDASQSRVDWMLELFARLEHEERQQRDPTVRGPVSLRG